MGCRPFLASAGEIRALITASAPSTDNVKTTKTDVAGDIRNSSIIPFGSGLGNIAR
jgi:hypothetical protein